MHEISAVIVDFDGTLAPQTNKLHARSFIEAFSEAGYEVTEDDLAPYFGVPQEQIIDTLLEGAGEDEVTALSSRKSELYMEFIKDEKLPEENVETVELLKDRGFGIAISSGAHASTIRALLPEHLIDHVFSADETIKPKPDPEILLKAAESLDTPPENCAYVGDSKLDHEAAHAADMLFIGVPADLTWPSLKKSTPDVLIDKFPELRNIFRRAPQEVDV